MMLYQSHNYSLSYVKLWINGHDQSYTTLDHSVTVHVRGAGVAPEAVIEKIAVMYYIY